MTLQRPSRNNTPGLFDRSEHSGPPPDLIIAHIDGGARGNPGPAGYGVIIRDAAGKTLAELSEFLGHRTNNYAEYSALLAALEYAQRNNYPAIKLVSDSELLVRQMNGQYKVKSPDLRPMYERARSLARQFQWFAIEHARREENRDADALANAAMDRGSRAR
ncbi:MAG: ribonuclease HI family protein [Acidobacteriales bacterium]|nr:ribonuclease HI family protein [Terriglobales bacterium]